MKSRLVYVLFLTILFSCITSYIVYFGFVSNYSHRMFSRPAFIDLYGKGIFHYRVLSRYWLLGLDDLIDPTGRQFYQTTFYFNTFFLVLTSIAGVLLLHLPRTFRLSEGEKILYILLIPLVINITQFVLVPYDTLGYFFQLLIAYLFLAFYEKEYGFATLSISLLLVVSTLNRESSAINLSFLITLQYFMYGWNRRTIFAAAAFILSFLVTYVLLRMVIGEAPPSGPNALIGHLGIFVNQVGIAFWLVIAAFVHLLANDRQNRRFLLCFYLLSTPYIFLVLKDGILWEIRLYIPLFLGSLLLSKLDWAMGSAPDRSTGG